MATVTERAQAWIVGANSGASSKTIWAVMTGVKNPRIAHPWDPGDLGRCLQLLELVPEWKPRIGEMAALSPTWARLVERWDEIAKSMEDEVGIDWSKGRSAPKTHGLMQSIIYGKSA